MAQKTNRFDGQIVLVTGGADGVGAACAKLFAEEGARVLIGDIQADKGNALAEELGPSASFVPLDVSDDGSWAAAIEGVLADPGALHILINNAGVSLPATVEDADFAHWRKVNSVNADGVFLGCHHAIPLIQRSGGGSIVNISSALGLKTNAVMPAYSASKAAVRMLTKSVALHCAEQGYGIRCNTVYPGSVRTPMIEKLSHDSGDYEGAMARRIAAHPIGFIAEPSDIANAVAFLASDDARFITGADLAVDGGLSL
ncbi:MAG: glucose 1-dehydrogenase [Alphaproteobacteria bacterium]